MISKALKSFKALKLPRENVGNLVKDALKYLQIIWTLVTAFPTMCSLCFCMQSEQHCCPTFNFQILVKLEKDLEMEDSVGQQKSQLEINHHPHYQTHNA